MGFIFSNSLKTGVESGADSSAVLDVVESIFKKIGINPDISELFIRKLAHFLEYAMLSFFICADILLFMSCKASDRRVEPFFIISPVFCFIVANVDEFCIQACTEGRGPSFFDVLIDTLGAVALALGFFARI